MKKTFSGSLSSFSLADLLQWIEINARSGRLTLTRSGIVRAVDVQDGAIVYASSSVPGERLAIHLATSRALTEHQVYALLVENLLTGATLSRLILDRGLLDRGVLAASVEKLATRILLDAFHWPDGDFSFDPMRRTEDVLQIQLALRGQAIAFLGAKSLDDTARGVASGRSNRSRDDGDWARRLRDPIAVEDAFWEALDETPLEESADRAVLRLGFEAFRRFASGLALELERPFGLLPIFDDTAALLRSALDGGADDDALVQIAALDPFLTIDLLTIGNSLRLSTDPRGPLGTARTAAEAIGPEALRGLASGLADPSAAYVSSSERLERVVRRASLSTAAAASHVATALGDDAEAAFTLGLIEPVGGWMPLKLLIAADFPAGGLRASALARLRPVYGRALARKLNLDAAGEAILGSSGKIGTESSDAERLVFLAKQMVAIDQIGSDWSNDDPALADHVAELAGDADLPTRIAGSVQGLFEILKL